MTPIKLPLGYRGISIYLLGELSLAYHGKYKSPTDLLLDKSLSHDEKVEMLEQWRDDKKALMRASEEGMQGDDRLEVLRKIKEALNSLREGSLSP